MTGEPPVGADSAGAPRVGATPNPRRAVGLVLRTSFAIQLLGSISGIELARGLGVHNRGVLAAATLWPLVAGNLGTLGIEESTTYHVARAPRDVSRVTGSALVLCAVQSAIFGALTLALVPLVLSRHPTGVIVSAWIYTLYVPLQSFSITLNAVLNGLHRYEWFNRVLLSLGLLMIAIQTLLLVLGVMTVRLVVITYVGTQLITTLYTAWLVRRAGVKRVHADRQIMRRLFGYGIRSHASTVPTTLNYSLDQLVISIFLTTRQLGIYVIAVTMSSFTILIGQAVSKAALPNVASLKDAPERALLARRLVSTTMLVSVIVTVPIVVLLPELITVFFGRAYLGAVGVGRIVLIATVALSTNRVIEAVLRGIGRPLDAGIAEIVALGVTIVGLAVLLPPLGILGAGWTSVASYLVAMAYMIRQATRALEIGPGRLLNPDWSAIPAAVARIWGARARHASG